MREVEDSFFHSRTFFVPLSFPSAEAEDLDHNADTETHIHTNTVVQYTVCYTQSQKNTYINMTVQYTGNTHTHTLLQHTSRNIYIKTLSKQTQLHN